MPINYQLDRYGYLDEFSWRRLARQYGNQFATFVIRNPDLLREGLSQAWHYFQARKNQITPKVGSAQEPKTAKGGIGFGMYGGRFKRPRANKKPSPYSVQIHSEKGGEVLSTDCAYVGHGPAVRSIWDMMWEAIILRLFKDAGHTIQSMDEPIKGNWVTGTTTIFGRIIVTYRSADQGVVIPEITNVSATDTYQTKAAHFYDTFWTLAVPNKYQFLQIAYQVNDTNFTTTDAKLDLTTMLYEYKLVSVMNIQNRTPGDTATDLTSDSINANPLNGKLMKLKGNSMQMRYADVTQGITPVFKVNDLSGVVAFDGVATGLDAVTIAVLKRPPTAGAIENWKGVTGVTLAPGGYRKDVLKLSVKMSVNKMAEVLQPAIDQSGEYVNLGYTNLVSLAKTLRTGTGTQPITLGYEINQHHTGTIYKTKAPTVSKRHFVL